MNYVNRKIGLLSAIAIVLTAAMSVVSIPISQASEATADPPERPSGISNTLAQNYSVPKSAVFVSPSGSDANPGTKEAPLKTVNFAATKAKGGGTVVLRDGVYREGAAGYSTGGTQYIIEPKNLTIQAYPGEEAWMDGTVPVSSWAKTAGGDYKTAWSTPDFCNGDYYSRHYSDQTKRGPCSASDSIGGAASLGNPQMVFVNGQEIDEVASSAALTAKTFFYDWHAREIHLGFNPAGKTVEVTKYPQAMALLKPSNVTIRDVGFRRYASNQYGGATSGALLLNAGSDVTLERVVVKESAGTGLLAWNIRNLTVRSSSLSSNGASGMNFAGSAQKLAKNPSIRDNLVIESSRLDSNNTDSYSIGCTWSCAMAGFKGSGVVGARIENNSFSHNGGKQASGVWFDLDAKDVAIIGNEVVGNARHGVIYEVSDTGIIASNLIHDNGWESVKSSSYGLMVGSANTKIYNNTITQNKYGVYLYDDSRSPGSNTGYDPTRVGPNSVNVSFVNNIVSSHQNSPYLIVVGGGKSSVPGNTSADQVVKTMDHNSYGITAGAYFFTWRQREGGPAKVYDSVASLRTAKGKESNGDQTRGTVDVSVATTGAPLPADVAKALGKRAGAVLARGLISEGADVELTPVDPTPVDPTPVDPTPVDPTPEKTPLLKFEGTPRGKVTGAAQIGWILSAQSPEWTPHATIGWQWRRATPSGADVAIPGATDSWYRLTGTDEGAKVYAVATGSAKGYATTSMKSNMSSPVKYNVYSTPGKRTVNGRQWRTTCEPYSTTQRCRTEIWASQVKYGNGRFVKSTDWVFNNLTYLPSPRSLWKGNNLGKTSDWWSQDRHWKTECGTAKTGSNACRSYIWADYISSSQGVGGVWSHRNDAGWVMNSQVIFS